MKPELEGVVFQGLSRRAFLVSSGAAAIAVAFGGLVGAKKALAQAKELRPSLWMRVATDGTVILYAPAAEMGQGVMTAMPLLIAEEMDLDWSKVKVEQAPYAPGTFGNPLFGGGMVAGASRTTRGYYEIMRLAGMEAREIMLQSVARRWGVAVSELSTEPHMVVHRASGRKIGYGEIASFAEVPATPTKFTREQLKPASQFRLIGKDIPRVDVPDKSTGKAKYGIDVRMPGMMYAAVQRAPVHGETPQSVDDAEAKKVPGVKQVIRMPWGVGVVAENYPAAMKGKKALKVTWSNQSKARAYTTETMLGEFTKRVRNIPDEGVVYEKHGDAKGEMGKAVKKMSAEFTSLNVTHMQMEPMNATALVEGDKIEFWVGTQAPTLVWLTAVKGLGFNPANVTINTMFLGGGFGRRTDNDFTADAGFLAKAMPGTPVKVVWSREDDVQWTKPRPLIVQRVEAGLDAQNNIVAWHHRIVSESIYARFAPPAFQKAGGRDVTVCEGAFELDYSLPNFQLDYLREQRGVDVHVWRAVGSGYTKHAVETFIDEIAEATKQDPVALRMKLLEKHPRSRKVIEEAMAMSGWTKKRPAGRALGLAFSESWETKIAQVAEVSVNRKTGKITVHEVWSAVDTGVALQPKNVEAQIESSVVFGLSALKEKLLYKDGVPQAQNFHNYPVIRMNEVPKITTKVIVTNSKPGGIGEVGLPAVAPAVAQAVFKLTGKRLHSLPFDENSLKA